MIAILPERRRRARSPTSTEMSNGAKLDEYPADRESRERPRQPIGGAAEDVSRTHLVSPDPAMAHTTMPTKQPAVCAATSAFDGTRRLANVWRNSASTLNDRLIGRMVTVARSSYAVRDRRAARQRA